MDVEDDFFAKSYRARLYGLHDTKEGQDQATDSQWLPIGGVCNVYATSSEDGKIKIEIKSASDTDLQISIVLPVDEIAWSDKEGDTYISFTYEGARMSLSMGSPMLTDGLRKWAPRNTPSEQLHADAAPSSSEVHFEGTMEDALPALDMLPSMVQRCRQLLSHAGSSSDSVQEGGQGMNRSVGHCALTAWLLGGVPAQGAIPQPSAPIVRCIEAMSEALDIGDCDLCVDARAMACFVLESVAGEGGEYVLEFLLGDDVFPTIYTLLDRTVAVGDRFSFRNSSIRLVQHAGVLDALPARSRVLLEQLIRLGGLAQVGMRLDACQYEKDVAVMGFAGTAGSMWLGELPQAESVVAADLLAGVCAADGMWSTFARFISTLTGELSQGQLTKISLTTVLELSGWLRLFRLVLLHAVNATTYRPKVLRLLVDAGIVNAVETGMRVLCHITERPLEAGALVQRVNAEENAKYLPRVPPAYAELCDLSLEVLLRMLDAEGGAPVLRKEIVAKSPLMAPAFPIESLSDRHARIAVDVVSSNEVQAGTDEGCATQYVPCGVYCTRLLQREAANFKGPSLVFSLLIHVLASVGWQHLAMDVLRNLLIVADSCIGQDQFGMPGLQGGRSPDCQRFGESFIQTAASWLLLPFSDMVLPKVCNAPSSTAVTVLRLAFDQRTEPPLCRLSRARRLEIATLLAPGTSVSASLFEPVHTIAVELLSYFQQSYPTKMRVLHRAQAFILLTKGLRARTKLQCLAAAQWVKIFLASDDQLLSTDLCAADIHSALAAALVMHTGNNDMVCAAVSFLLVAMSPLQPTKNVNAVKLRLSPQLIHRYSEVSMQCSKSFFRRRPLLVTADDEMSAKRSTDPAGNSLSTASTPAHSKAGVGSGVLKSSPPATFNMFGGDRTQGFMSGFQQLLRSGTQASSQRLGGVRKETDGPSIDADSKVAIGVSMSPKQLDSKTYWTPHNVSGTNVNKVESALAESSTNGLARADSAPRTSIAHEGMALASIEGWQEDSTAFPGEIAGRSGVGQNQVLLSSGTTVVKEVLTVEGYTSADLIQASNTAPDQSKTSSRVADPSSHISGIRDPFTFYEEM